MTTDDVDAVIAVVLAADQENGRRPLTAERRERMRRANSRFVDRDPAGAWVAEVDGRVVGMAESVRRGSFWGLSMLFVEPESQNRGVGRGLLDAALGYSDGATERMILTSSDPRALRRYSRAGLAIHPTVGASGAIDRSAIPKDLPGRPGGTSDLGLADDVDAGLRGSRAEDADFLLSIGSRMEVVDHGSQRGYAVFSDSQLQMLGATDEVTAALLLWRVLAETPGDAAIWALTAEQDWAVKVALAARLKVAGAGPLFIDGRPRPPGPWIPSGWYF